MREWSAAGPTVAWRRDVGIGAASVVVAGNQVFTTGNRDDQDIVWCLRADSGDVEWQFTYDSPFSKRAYDGGTASTPTVDGDFVYTLSYEGRLFCLQRSNGTKKWERHLVTDFGGEPGHWMYAQSPLIEGNLIILDAGGAENTTLALAKGDGSKVWGTPIGEAGRGGHKAAYATPVCVTQAGRRIVIMFKATTVLALDVATGEELWRIPWKNPHNAAASSPIVLGDKLLLSTGWSYRASGRAALYQLKPDGPPEELWHSYDLKTMMNTSVIHDGYVFGLSETHNALLCIDMADGRTVWAEERLAKHGTLTLADGTLIIMTDRGELITAPATPRGFQPISRAKVLSHRSWVMPVLANGRIYCRSNRGELVCLDRRPNAGDVPAAN